jgi:hypothetical protein
MHQLHVVAGLRIRHQHASENAKQITWVNQHGLILTSDAVTEVNGMELKAEEEGAPALAC